MILPRVGLRYRIDPKRQMNPEIPGVRTNSRIGPSDRLPGCSIRSCRSNCRMHRLNRLNRFDPLRFRMCQLGRRWKLIRRELLLRLQFSSYAP